MLQRTLAVCISVMFLVPAIAQSCLTLPSEVVGAPGQNNLTAQGDLTLGASGQYFFDFIRTPAVLGNLTIGGVLGDLPNIAAKTPFFYASGTTRRFHVRGNMPVSGCANETITIVFYDIAGQKVCQRTVTFKCFQPKAVLSFNNGTGSGTPADPVRFCGAGKPVLLNGSQSATASTYAIELRQANGAAGPSVTLTPQEAQGIGNYDLRKFVPQGFFQGGKSYTVTLKTLPAIAEVTKTIAFQPATPAFRMKDRAGKVFDAGSTSAPITVCPGNMIMDADVTSCESSYFLTVQESDASWNRTYAYEWGRWFTNAEAPNGIDLDQRIAAHPDGLNPKKPFQMTAINVDILHSRPRYFRIGLATGEPAWDTRWLLVRTGTREECMPRVDTTHLQNPCPRTDNIPFASLAPELTRLFFTPCIYSTLPCYSESERQYLPTPVGPKMHKEPVWQAAVGSSSVVDIAQQDQIIAAMRKVAADRAPMCANGVDKKVPVAVELLLDVISGPPVQNRVNMGVWYACCGKIF